jgi:hypothetical protein
MPDLEHDDEYRKHPAQSPPYARRQQKILMKIHGSERWKSMNKSKDTIASQNSSIYSTPEIIAFDKASCIELKIT